VLSASTLAVLKNLNSPIEIRFYAPLGQTDVPDSIAAFAARVDRMLSEYERASGGKLSIVRSNPQLNPADRAKAEADGIRPVSFDETGLYYLGLTVTRDRQKESISGLSPEWEGAVELDLSRAIARATNVRATGVQVVNTSEPAIAAAEEAVRSDPRLTAVSLEEGTRILREAALAEFKTAAEEMQSKIAQTRQQIVDAQAANPAGDPAVVRKQLDQLQNEQMQKLKEIAARLQYQIAALERSKGISHAAPTIQKASSVPRTGD
jgi:hypothetical protein